MTHARPITTQGEWDKRHHRQEQQQKRSENISKAALIFSVLAMLGVVYFMTMVP